MASPMAPGASATSIGADATSAPAYRARRHITGGETEWRLAPDALECLDEGVPLRRYHYRDALAMRLAFDPTRVDRNRYRCDLTLRNGAFVRFFSTSYVSLGNFEDRGDSYAPFVRALVAEVAKASPACRFEAGKPLWSYLLEHGFLLLALIMLVWVIGLIGGLPPFGIALVKLGIIAFYVPVLIAYARRNWPRAFVPPPIPPPVLPG